MAKITANSSSSEIKIKKQMEEFNKIGDRSDEIGKLLERFPILFKAASKSPSLTAAIIRAAEFVAKQGKYSDELAAKLIKSNATLTLAAQKINGFKPEFAKFLQVVVKEKVGKPLIIGHGEESDEPDESEDEEHAVEREKQTPQIILEILALLNDIPLARMGDIITSEHHNSLRRAIHALARGFGSSKEQQILTFAPNFLPINQRQAQQFDWIVTFNKAVVPSEQQGPNMKGDTVKGAFLVQLPDEAQVQKMIVRGKRLTQEEVPTEFTVSLNRIEFDKPDPEVKVLIDFNLKSKNGTIKETGEVDSSSLGKVDNTKYRYYVSGNWENAGNSDRFEINSFQIFCDS